MAVAFAFCDVPLVSCSGNSSTVLFVVFLAAAFFDPFFGGIGFDLLAPSTVTTLNFWSRIRDVL